MRLTTRFLAFAVIFAPATLLAAPIQLWNNGGFVTHPGAGAGGADASSLQTGNIFGVGHQATTNNRVADDFPIPANTKFRLRGLEVFSYQTGSGTTSTITGITVQVWDGIPGGGGTIVYDSGSTNLMTASTFANAYRVSPASLVATSRPIMKCVCTFPGNGVLLDGGASGKTFWVAWQSTGSLSSGPWAVPVSILGQTGKGGANGRQFVGSAALWQAILDDGAPPGYSSPVPQDVTFNLVGNQTEVRAAASYVVTEGEEFGGDLASLGNSDDNRLELFNDPTTLAGRVEVTSLPTNNIGSSEAEVTVEHVSARPGLAVELALKNHTTSLFTVFYGASAPTTDVTNTLVSTSSDYLSGAGEMVLRGSWAPINDEDPVQDGWLLGLDFVRFKVQP